MRYVRYALLAIIMIVVILLAVANRDMTTLRLMPEGLAEIHQESINLPLFVVLLGTLLLGVVLGYVLEWGREMRQRREASERRRRIAQLEQELALIKHKTGEGKDDVLALLD